MQDREDYPYEAEAAQLHERLTILQSLGRSLISLSKEEIECLLAAIEVAYDY